MSVNNITLRNNISLALNPLDPASVLMAYNSEYNDGLGISAYAVSTDAGQTWQNGRFDILSGADPLTPYGGSDVAFDRQGTALYASMGVGNTTSGYFVVTSTVPSVWNTPVPVVISDYNTYRDEGRLAVDQRAAGPDAGNVYLLTRYFDRIIYGAVHLHVSHDDGQTWTTDIPVSDPSHEDCDGLSMAVAADGTLYAAFGEYPRDVMSFYLDRSTDGGRSWGPDQLITGAPITKTGTLDYKGHRMVLVGDADDRAFLMSTNPVIAVAPGDPQTVYVVWNDGRWDQGYMYGGHFGQHGDIAFTRTTDGGQTWSTPVRLNDDPVGNGVDQFQPSLAIGPGGVLGVSWYDRRDDPQHFLYAVYYSQSSDGGQTWSANQRVGDVLGDPMAVINGKGEGSMGDYSALVFGPDYVLPGWTDGRGSLGFNVYTDRGVFGAPSPTASVVPSQTPVASPTATASLTASPSASPGATLSPSPSASPSATPSPGPTACALTFADVPPDAYFAAAVRCLACRGIVGGYPCGGPGEPCPGLYYRPGNEVTRGQVSKIIANAAGYSEPAEPRRPLRMCRRAAPSISVSSGWPGGASSAAIPAAGRSSRASPRPTAPTSAPTTTSRAGSLPKSSAARRAGPKPPPARPSRMCRRAAPSTSYIERIAGRGIVNGYPCGGVGEPCVAPDQPPLFPPHHHRHARPDGKDRRQHLLPRLPDPHPAVDEDEGRGTRDEGRGMR